MQQKKYSAIIFDMDGTIIDTKNIFNTATLEMITEKKASKIQINFILNKIATEELGLYKSCALIKKELNIDTPIELLMQEKKDRTNALFKKNLKFIPGFKNFFKSLKKYNLKTALATNAAEETLELVDKYLNLKQFFGEHMYSIKNVGNIYKPAPDIYLYAALKLNIPTYNCIAIEDYSRGIDAAQAAGIFCIGLNSSKNYNQIKQANCIAENYTSINLEDLLHQN